LYQAFLKYKYLWIILSSWIIIGNIFQPAAYALVIISMLFFYLKQRYIELIIGFLFILLLSDHVNEFGVDPTQFAKDLKSIYLLFLLFVVWRKRKDYTLWNPIFTTLLPFFILSFISLIWAINLPVGFQKTISYSILYLIIPILFVNVFKDKKGEFIYALLVYFILILSIGILLYFIYPSSIRIADNRFSGLLGNPNGLGLILVQIFLLFTIIDQYPLVDLSKLQKRIIYALIIASLLMSGSRNGMISIVLFLLLVRVFKMHFLLGLLVLFSAFYIYESVTIDPVVVIETLGLQDYFRVDTLDSGSGRFIAWGFAWKEIQNYYFMGGGFGQDEQVMRPNYHMLAMLGHQGGVHNSYFSMWLDTGIIGLILYFGGMITLIWRAAKNSPLAWPFFFTILFNITYESWLVGSLNPFTILFLCSLTLLVMKPSFVDKDESLIVKSDIAE